MFKSKKSLGQNFLIDKNIAKKIVNLTNIQNQKIIEIGPGKGILTDEILNKEPKLLTIIEKDRELYNILKKKYEENNKIKIINCDALQYNYLNLTRNHKIISNLPYNISVKLIIKWIQMKKNLMEIIVMIQKDVAEKMNYNNNLKKNRLNLLLEISSEFSIKFNVSNKVFRPKPKVQSSVIKINPKKKENIDFDKFEKFTRAIFKFKRKKLSNVLPKNIQKSDLINIDLLNRRAEDLSTEKLLYIFKEFYNY